MVDNRKETYDNMIKLVIKNTGATPINNCLLFINDTKTGFSYHGVTGFIDETQVSIVKNHRFRTGSITKIFTATIIFQLIEEGILSLTDNFIDLVNYDTKILLKDLLLIDGTNYTDTITVRQLLEHKSGLNDYFSDDKRFFEYLTSFPKQQWNWKLVMDKYFEYGLNSKTASKPNTTLFHYADTNYLLLAILIEELTNNSFHKVLEERIVAPLGLENTYLEFYQPAKGSFQNVYPMYGSYSLKDINTSFDWGGGGLISTAPDLNKFIRALVSGELFKKEMTLRQMLYFKEKAIEEKPKKRKTLFGMGLQQKNIAGLDFIGHSSIYGAMMFYNRSNEISIILSLNQAAAIHKAEWLMNKAIGEYLTELDNQ